MDLQLQWQIDTSRMWSIEWRHFLWSWTTPNQHFQGHAIIWRWISQ